MEEYSGAGGRWRGDDGLEGPSLAPVIRWTWSGELPAGALLPTSERVAAELVIEPADVQAAYARLLADGLLEERVDGVLCIELRETTVGAPCFEAAQLRKPSPRSVECARGFAVRLRCSPMRVVNAASRQEITVTPACWVPPGQGAPAEDRWTSAANWFRPRRGRVGGARRFRQLVFAELGR